MTRENEYGQPIGDDLGDWRSPGLPAYEALGGRTVQLRPLVDADAAALHPSFQAHDELWTYMPFGPFLSVAELHDLFAQLGSLSDWQMWAIEVGGQVLGFCAYLRIDPPGGVIEIGSIAYSPNLQRTTAATEAMALLIGHAFAEGYRRVEWKCDGLNEPSRRTAMRLGFVYEGTFRQATHYKGRNRDTAWFAITDDDWPVVDAGFREWLSPENFGPNGEQRQTLEEFRR